MFRRLKALSRLKKIGLGVATVAVLGLASAGNQPKQANLNIQNSDRNGVLGAQMSNDTTKPKAPVITTQTETETQPIPFTTTSVNTSSLPIGQSKITTIGVNGVSTLTYKVTLSDGQQTAKQLVSQVATMLPVTQVTSVGTYIAPAYATPKPVATTSTNCDANYSGACVPNVYPSDVDCANGNGNGPYYVHGPVYVTGTDHYNLDADHDGVACE